MPGSPSRLIAFLVLSSWLYPMVVQAQPAPAGETRLRLIYFGQTQGVSSHIGFNEVHDSLYELVGETLEALKPIAEGPLVFAREGSVLFSDTPLTLDEFRRFLGDGPHEVTPVANDFSIYSTPYDWVIEWSTNGVTPILDSLSSSASDQRNGQRVQGRLSRVASASGTHLYILSPSEVSPITQLDPDPGGYEIRFALFLQATPKDGAPRTLINIGKPFHEGARRLAVIKGIKSQAPGESLILSAGDDVETWSFIDSRKPDLQRPHSWSAFKSMGLDILAPGPRELAFGVDALMAEAEAHGVKLVATNLADKGLPQTFSVKSAGLNIVVLGLLDPGANLITIDNEKLTVLDPAKAACAAVDAYVINAGRAPDLVVALGQLNHQTRRKLVQNCPQVDLALTDFDDLGLLSESARLAPTGLGQRLRREPQRKPLTILEPGRQRLGFVDISTQISSEKTHLTQMDSHVVGVPGDMPPDPEFARRIQETRLAAYAPAQEPLLPPLGELIDSDPDLRDRFDASAGAQGENMPAYVTPALWRGLVGGVLADSFSADIVAISPLSRPWVIAGPMSRLEGAANLNVPFRLVMIQASKKELLAWAAAVSPGEVGLTGFDLSSKKVGGRPLDDRVRYRVLLSEDLLDRSAFKKLSTKAQIRRFRASGHRYVADTNGHAVTLRDSTMAGLTHWGRDRASLLNVWRRRQTPVARWVLDLKGINIALNRVGRSGGTLGYDAVRETRVSTPANHQVALGGVLGLGWQSTPLTWMNAVNFEYAKAWYDEAENQETADAIGFSTELQVGQWTIRSVDAIPFIQGSFATEFTPTDGEDGLNPRKLQTDGILGFLWRGKVLKTARLATLMTRDFSSPIPDVQAGFLGQAETMLGLSFGNWVNTMELRYYLPDIGDEDASELALRVQGRSAFQVPLMGPLSLSAFVDLFGYRGQVAPALDPGLNIMSGLALNLDRLMPLAHF